MYQLPDPKIRGAERHEYFNTRTQEYEVVRSYGLYEVRETFLTPDGTILLLGHNEHSGYPWVIGEHNGTKDGVYWADATEARRNFAWLIAESFDLTVGTEGSAAVVPASRQYASTLVQQIKKTSEDLGSAVEDQDVQGLDRSAAGLRDAAVSLAKHFQRIGVLSETVYERWEWAG
jgi:hypothetical protein